MTFELGLPQISLGVIFLGIIQYIISLLVSERLKVELQRENAMFIEKFRWEQKAREQAARVAEYMAIANDLLESSSPSDYQKANQLAWELAMWLPEDVYKTMAQALIHPDLNTNILSVVVAVRKILLGDSSGNLTKDQILVHKPGIGKVNV